MQLFGGGPFFLDLASQLHLRWQNLNRMVCRVHNGKQDNDVLSLVENFADTGFESRTGLDLSGMLSIQDRKRRLFLPVEQLVQHLGGFLINAASDSICGPFDAASDALPCMSSLRVSAISEAEKGFSSTRKLPPVG